MNKSEKLYSLPKRKFLKYRGIIVGGGALVIAQGATIFFGGNVLLHSCVIGLISLAFIYRITTANV